MQPKLFIKNLIEKIEETLKAEKISWHPFINQVSEYILFSGGKRIRPLLHVLSYNLTKEIPKSKPLLSQEMVYKTSLLFEYLHAATLLHDDVVDGAEFRRGRRAARNVWGNQATILVGDFLYARSLKIASRLKNPEFMEVITETTLLMSEGEVIQLLNMDNLNLTEREYEEVIFRKTAVLISAACETGAILGGADKSLREKLKNFGIYIGFAFQIVDDLLDYTSEKTGKDLGKDFKEGKVTLPVIYALKKADENTKNLLKKLFTKDNPTFEDFKMAYQIIEKYEGFLLSQKKAKEYVEKAKNLLSELPKNPYKKALLFIADYIVKREK